MKTAAVVAPDKLRGGFYTPSGLVQHCLSRIASLNGHATATILEPTVGDGAFLRALLNGSVTVDKFVGIELVEEEARKCVAIASEAPFESTIVATNFLDWVLSSSATDHFDVAVGNPPFVRYQFIGDNETRSIEKLGTRLGVSFRGVSNLWIPILLGALSRLKPGGTMAFVVPAELLTGISAGVVRGWLIQNFEALRVDLFPPGSFPEVLQEVIVLSGRRLRKPSTDPKQIEFVEHSAGQQLFWQHCVGATEQNWTKYLLTQRQLETVAQARLTPGVMMLGDIARFEVSIVTGANAYFSVSTLDVAHSDLAEWAIPLLPRIRNAPGLVYSNGDHKLLADGVTKAWFLDFSDARRDPQEEPLASAYLRNGESMGLHLRYKTSIRTPWYRVPSVSSGRLMLSKRSHTFPRMVLNEAGVVTTDTIYRGDVLPMYGERERDVVTNFHNSLTLLDAELEGRSFGGGVLELVPSEVARLSLPFGTSSPHLLGQLDSCYRSTSAGLVTEDTVIEITNSHLADTHPGLTARVLEDIEIIRRELQARRLSRNR